MSAMWKLARSIAAVILGAALSIGVISGIDAANHAIYPPPAAVHEAAKKRDMRAVAAPLGALVMIPVAWVVGTLVGSLAAALIAGRAPLIHALIAGVLPLAGTIAALRMIPHPTWIAVVGLVGVPLSSLAAGIIARRLWRNGPRPYDMREKNMAC